MKGIVISLKNSVARKVLAMALMVTVLSSIIAPVFASDVNKNENVTLLLGSVNLTVNDGVDQQAARNGSNTPLEIPSLVVQTHNDDGTITDDCMIWVAEDGNGNLVSAVSPDDIKNNAEIMASGSYTGAIYGSTAYSIKMEATYSSVNMNDATHGYQSGYCFAPVSAKFKFTKNSGTTKITTTDMMTGLHGANVRSNTSPNPVVDGYPDFTRSYTSTGPISGYQYSFDDYTAYVNEGFSGKYIYVPYGYGSYFLKTDFTYGAHEYSCVYGICNVSNSNYVIS